MDSQIVYVKTASGEEAMHQRTRVMQRNVRMVLILVDGKSTVADLILKTGNQKLTENALRELEKADFIAPVVEQDSLWAEGKKVAQEIRAAAIGKARKLSPSNKKEAPDPKNEPAPLMPSPPEASISLHSAFANPKWDSSISQFSVAPIPPLQFGKPVDGQRSSVFSQPDEKNAAIESASRSESSTPSILERIKAALSPRQSDEDDNRSLKPIRRGQQRRIGWPAMLGSALFGVIAIVALTVLAFPYGHYLPEVEAAFAKATGQRVKVGAVRVEMYPKPGLFLSDVQVGQNDGGLRISNIALRPVIGSLLSKRIGLKRVELRGLKLSPQWVLGIPEVLSGISNPASGVAIESIIFEQTEVSYNGLGFSDLQGELKVAGDGRFQSLLLSTTDRGLSIELKPQEKALGVAIEGSGWRPSEKSPFLLTSVSLKGRIEKSAMTIDEMDLRLFDGVVKGVLVLLGEKQPSLSGKLSFERINASRLGDAFGLGTQFSGELAGSLSCLATSETWNDIFSAMQADSEFTIRRGSLQGIDLAEAVRRISASPVEGGKTVFEQFSGKLRVSPTAYQFASLVLDSGLMQAAGGAEVSKDLRINGKMELQMRGSVNQMRVPVTITGQLKKPTVQVGK